jgi:hypothetical protein
MLAERLCHRATQPANNLSAVTVPELCYWALRHREQLFQRVLAERLSHRVITCWATLPRVILPQTRPELCHWPARHREQLF